MNWQINVPSGTKHLSLQVQSITQTLQMEEFRITGKDISFVIRNNRPLIEAIERPYPMQIKWTVVRGDINDHLLLDKITKAIEKNIQAYKAQVDNNIKMYAQVKQTA